MKKIVFLLAIVFVTNSFLSSCNKEGEYYEYKNQLQTYSGSTYDYILNQSNFDSLQKVIEKLPNRKEFLQNQSNTTVFACTNRSFELAFQNFNKIRKMQNKSSVYLDDIPSVVLDTLIGRYFFDNKIETNNLANVRDGASYESAFVGHSMHIEYARTNASGFLQGGAQQLIFSEMNGSIFERYWVRTHTISVNLLTQNGVVHTLTPDHGFSFGLLSNLDI